MSDYMVQTKRTYQRRYDSQDSGRNFYEAMEAFARIIRSETNINEGPHKVRVLNPNGTTLATATYVNGEWK